VTSKGQSIRFKESDVREMGRVPLALPACVSIKGDFVIGADVVKKDLQKPAFLLLWQMATARKLISKNIKFKNEADRVSKPLKSLQKPAMSLLQKLSIDDESELVAMSKEKPSYPR
jgi:DNA gyrase/topoisomerase IV subunit A